MLPWHHTLRFPSLSKPDLSAKATCVEKKAFRGVPVAFASGEFFRVVSCPWAVAAKQVQVTCVDGTCFSRGEGSRKGTCKRHGSSRKPGVATALGVAQEGKGW